MFRRIRPQTATSIRLLYERDLKGSRSSHSASYHGKIGIKKKLKHKKQINPTLEARVQSTRVEENKNESSIDNYNIQIV